MYMQSTDNKYVKEKSSTTERIHRMHLCALFQARTGPLGIPPPAKLDRHHMAYHVLVQRKTQPQK